MHTDGVHDNLKKQTAELSAELRCQLYKRYTAVPLPGTAMPQTPCKRVTSSAQRRSPAAGRPMRARLAALERIVEVRADWRRP